MIHMGFQGLESLYFHTPIDHSAHAHIHEQESEGSFGRKRAVAACCWHKWTLEWCPFVLSLKKQHLKPYFNFHVCVILSVCVHLHSLN